MTNPSSKSIYHVVEHFSLHTGQIIYVTKLLRKEDLGFYKHLTIPAGLHLSEKIPSKQANMLDSRAHRTSWHPGSGCPAGDALGSAARVCSGET